MDRLASPAPPPARLLTVAWAAIVAAVWFGLFVPSMRPGIDGSSDLDGYFFPKYVYGSETLLSGELPLWNPYELCGTPFVGASQPAVFYPPRLILFALMPPTAALHVFMLVHYVLLGVGVFLALRALDLDWPGASLGAIVVTFQPFIFNPYTPHWLAGFTWLPYVVAAFVRTLERPSVRPGLGLAASGTLLVLSGYPEYAVDTSVTLGVIWLFVAARAVRSGNAAALGRGTLVALAAAVAILAVTAIHWVPVVEVYRNSVRQGLKPRGFDLLALLRLSGRRWWEAVTQLVYVPPLVVGLSIAAAVLGTSRYRMAMLAVTALCVGALTALRTWPPFAWFHTPLCWAAIFHLSLATLAGDAFDQVFRGQGSAETRLGRADLVACAIAAVATIVPSLPSPRTVGWLLVGSVALVCLRGAAGASRRAWTFAVLGSLLGAELTFVPSIGSRPAPLHRFALGQAEYPRAEDARRLGEEVRAACGKGGRVLTPSETWRGVPLLAQLATVQGYPESLRAERMEALLSAIGIPSLQLFLVQWKKLPSAPHVLRLLDMRCILAPATMRPLLETLGFTAGKQLADGRVAYRRPGVHVFVVGAVRAVAGPEDALAAVLDQNFAPEREVVLEGISRSGSASPGVVLRGEGEGQSRFDLQVSSPAGGYVVVSETWYPGWRAWVDGRATEVRRADFAFLAVPVSPGSHRVELRYVPRGFGAAVVATLIAATALVVPGAKILLLHVGYHRVGRATTQRGRA